MVVDWSSRYWQLVSSCLMLFGSFSWTVSSRGLADVDVSSLESSASSREIFDISHIAYDKGCTSTSTLKYFLWEKISKLKFKVNDFIGGYYYDNSMILYHFTPK